jgi:hypothetical protein
MASNTFTFKEQLAASQAIQILHSHGLNALKRTFINFGTPATQDEPDAHSHLGTPIFDTVTLYGNGNNGDITYYDLTLQKEVSVPKMTIDIALVTCTKVVNIVKTNVVGANGTVKQYINLGDYNIEIKGTFTSEIADTMPMDLIRQLHKITSATTEINIASNLLTLFGVTCIVFEGEQVFAQDESQRDVQKFTLNAISEHPFVIRVTSQGNTTSNASSKSVPFF